MRRRKSGLIWAFATAAPWALAGGMLISFTATAGQDVSSGISFAGVSRGLALTAADIVPGNTRATATMIGLPALDLGDALRPVPLVRGDVADAQAQAPRGELKRYPGAWPEIARGRKGDPLRGVAPTVSRQGHQAARARATERQAFLGRDIRLLPPTLLMEGSTEIPTVEDMWGIEPLTEEEAAATRLAIAPRTTPAYVRAGGTVIFLGDGATPPSPAAQALASVTPAPADAVPVEIAAVPLALPPDMALDLLTRREPLPPRTTIIARTPSQESQPRYADLLNADNMRSEARCLAEAVYFEARGESEAGQAAVAQVVLNRVKSGLYPKSVCGVVYQNRHRFKACQFSFACEGRSLRISDRRSWNVAVRVAEGVVAGEMYNAEVGGATHYHADYVRPFWASKLKKMDVIGRHIFYKLRPGQT
ncbi:MAG: cell wall hydrolase [Pseudochelatococcus sp.]|jgi:spore germination cell wall hydrolase CwlJ-like protein|uniref:cell wall hydrolase n=1 Tax=Pseudochelatococcus sp. TaxID=2020869 RepID=UPI003D8BAD17